MIAHPWVIPFIPAVSALVILFFGTRMPKRGAEIGIGAMFSSVVLSTWLAIEWIIGPHVAHESQHIWFTIEGIDVKAGTLTDGLMVMMTWVVSFVSLLVQIFSTNYMRFDQRYTHFFAILTFFTAAMQWFAMSANTLQMIFGWEVMSLCSFLLIGHWWEEKSNVHAAMKAFLTTRASDIGLFVGMIMLFFAAGSTFDVALINRAALSSLIDSDLLTLCAIALFIAVIGKSAQFPLHTWLPDAMAGPTPMSALIHAATMVVAGVYLVARLYPVFVEGLNIGGSGFNLIAIIGAITIVIAALLALIQTDLKKLLSYSTVSQLGYMILALGVGAWVAAVFHLFTHAFFKALLFLNAGSVSHAVHGFDLERDMGGLRKKMPITHATFVIGAGALVGVIPLSGFWSKELITAQAGNNGYVFFQIVAIVGTFLTACYMMRCYYLMFAGEHRGSSYPHESPKIMTVPLILLAIPAALFGLLELPALHWFSDWVVPNYVAASEDHSLFTLPFLFETLAYAGGIALGITAFLKGFGPRQLAGKFRTARRMYSVLHNRYYIDWLYEKVFVHGIRRGLSWLVHWVDHNLIDNFVDFVGRFTVRLGELVDRQIDRNVIDGMVHDTSVATEGAGEVLSRVQNGKVQRYMILMLTTVVLVIMILVLGS